MLAPVNVPRYAKYPLGNGQPYHLLELIQSSPQIFADGPSMASARRLSDTSIQSAASGMIDNVPLTTINALQQRWWGSKRLDYALYCPDGLSNFPAHALPHLFHASYWESSDVIAFILRQIGRFDNLTLVGGGDDKDGGAMSSFRPAQAREKWNRKRTSVKLKNVTANHRANDVIVKDGEPQRLVARFMYGPLDMITLAGECFGEKFELQFFNSKFNLLTVQTDKIFKFYNFNKYNKINKFYKFNKKTITKKYQIKKC